MNDKKLTIRDLQEDIDSIAKYISILEPLDKKFFTDNQAATAFDDFVKQKLAHYEIQGIINMLKKVSHKLETIVQNTPVDFNW